MASPSVEASPSGQTPQDEGAGEGARAPLLPALFEHAIARMRESVIITDATLKAPGPYITFVNAAFTRMTGYTEADILGKSPRVLQGPQTSRKLLDRLRRRLKNGEPFEGKAINYRKDGSPFVVEWYIEALALDPSSQRPTHYVAVQRDVSDQRERDVAIQNLSAVLERSGEALTILTGSGAIRYQNPAAERLFPTGPELPRTAWRALDEDGEWEGRLDLLLTDDTRAIRVRAHAVPATFGESPDYIISATDLTKVKRLESIARSVNLSQNLGHFVSGVRHELGNPANSIKTALTVLRGNLDTWSPDRILKYIDRMHGEVARIEYLLRSLRSFGANESLSATSVPLTQWVREVVSLARPDLRQAGIDLVVGQVPSGQVRIDTRAMYQVFINLISNATEALADQASPRIELRFEATDELLRIRVEDNGRGVDPDLAERVFQPFFTTKASGTGLGLAIARRFLAWHDGDLELMPRERGGTVAVLTLPFSRLENVPPRTQFPTRPADPPPTTPPEHLPSGAASEPL